MKNNLKIGFLTAHDPTDRKAWSGIIHHLADSLAKHAGEVVFLGPAITGKESVLGNWDRRFKKYLGKSYDVSHSLYLSAAYARVFEDRLKKDPVDVIFAPVASTEIALLKTSTPIVYMSDTTFAAINGYYADFTNLIYFSRFEANFIERLAIKKATYLIYPSKWASESAINDYQAAAEKIFTFPMGANIDYIPDDEQIAVKQRIDKIRLLFVGVDWDRKGGQIAVDAVQFLEQMGIPASLTIVGCQPPFDFIHPNVTVIPFLNRNVLAERQQLFDLYLNSDIFILPTRAECMGIVFCEAAAFGLPCFASSTGGIPAVIEHGKTGYLFSLDAEGFDYAEEIAKLWQDPTKFFEMVKASREKFKNQLNWDAWGKEAANVLDCAAIKV